MIKRKGTQVKMLNYYRYSNKRLVRHNREYLAYTAHFALAIIAGFFIILFACHFLAFLVAGHFTGFVFKVTAAGLGIRSNWRNEQRHKKHPAEYFTNKLHE
ncbi:MAG TPA: hypothetical protein DIV86_01040 [Alphaproteobacteria bacterium]|mgnify:CR=1 FL=1|nr:hypothetical protein [Alphaproteobacteria bacterium]